MLDLLKRVQTDDAELNRDITIQIMESTMIIFQGEDEFVEASVGRIVKNIFKKLENVESKEERDELIDMVAKEISQL